MKITIHPPGSGKTRALIRDLISLQKEKIPSIIAVPTLALMYEIYDAIIAAGGRCYLEYTTSVKQATHKGGILITTHAYLAKLALGSIPHGCIVAIDECHCVKNPVIRRICQATSKSSGYVVLMTATPTKELFDLKPYFAGLPTIPLPNLDSLKADKCRIRLIRGCQLMADGRMCRMTSDGPVYADLTYSPSSIARFILQEPGQHVPVLCAENAVKCAKAAGRNDLQALRSVPVGGAACTSAVAQGVNVAWYDGRLFDGKIGIKADRLKPETALQIAARSRNYTSGPDGFRKCHREIIVFTDANEAFCDKFVQAAERAGVFEITVEHGVQRSPVSVDPEVKKRIAKQISLAIICAPEKMGDVSYSYSVGMNCVPSTLNENDPGKLFLDRFGKREQTAAEKTLVTRAYFRAAHEMKIVERWADAAEKAYAPGGPREIARMEKRCAFTKTERSRKSPGATYQQWLAADFRGKCVILAKRSKNRLEPILNGVLYGKRTKETASVYGSRFDHPIVGINDQMKAPIIGSFYNVDLKVAHPHMLFGKPVEYTPPPKQDALEWARQWRVSVENHIVMADRIGDIPDSIAATSSVSLIGETDRAWVKTVTVALVNLAGSYGIGGEKGDDRCYNEALDDWMILTGNSGLPRSQERWEGLRSLQKQCCQAGLCASDAPPLMVVEQLAVNCLLEVIGIFGPHQFCSDGLLYIASRLTEADRNMLESMKDRIHNLTFDPADMLQQAGLLTNLWLSSPLRYDVEFIEFTGVALIDADPDRIRFWASAEGDDLWSAITEEEKRNTKKSRNARDNSKNNANQPTTRAGRRAKAAASID